MLESSKEVVSAGKAAEDLGLTGRRDDQWVCRSMVDGVALNYEMGVRFPTGPLLQSWAMAVTPKARDMTPDAKDSQLIQGKPLYLGLTNRRDD